MIHIETLLPGDLAIILGIWEATLGGGKAKSILPQTENLCRCLKSEERFKYPVVSTKYDPRALLELETTSKGRVRAYCKLQLNQYAEGYHRSHIASRKFTEAVDAIS